MFRKTLEIREHSASVYSIDYDGNFLYSGSADNFVTRWDLKTGTQDRFAIKFNSPVYSILVCEGKLYVGLSTGELFIFDLETREEIRYYVQHVSALFSLTGMLNNCIFAGDADGNLSVWDAETLDLKIFLPLACGKIRDIQTDETGNRIMLSCQDGSVRIFDVRNFNENKSFHAHRGGVTASVFDPNDPNKIITAGKDAHIRRWNLETNVCDLAIPAHNYAVYRIIRVKDMIVSASRDKSIKIWSSELDFVQKLDAKEGGHSHSVDDLCKINDTSFASCGDDRRIILWTEGEIKK